MRSHHPPLDKELGVALYVKEGRALRLTEHGERVLAFARDIEEQTRRFLAELRGEDEQGPVVLCAGEAITRYVLVAALRATRAQVRLLLGDSAAAVAAVREGRAQIGVVGAMHEVPQGIAAQPLLAVPQALAVPDDHPLAAYDELPLSAAAGQALVLPPPGRPHRVALQRALGDLPYSVAAEVHGWDLMLQLVSARIGVAVVNGFVPAPEGVVLVPVVDLPRIRYEVVYREGYAPSPAATRLISAMREAARAVRTRGTRAPNG